MNKSVLFFAGIITTFGLIISSCSKDRLEAEKVNTFQSMDEFMDMNKQPEQEFLIDSGGTGPIVGKDGTQLYVGKDLFTYPDGSDIDWPYKVTLVELYTPKDMILWEMPTVTTGKEVLQTGGEFRIRAFKDDQELVIRSGAFLHVKGDTLEGAPVDGMEPYDSDVEPKTVEVWSNSLHMNLMGAGTDTTGVNYFINTTKLNWINIDKIPESSGGKSSLKAKFEGSVEGGEFIKAFVVFKDWGSVVLVQDLKTINLPNDQQVEVVLFAKTDQDKFVWFNKSMTVTKNEEITIDFVEVTEQELLTNLQAL